MHILLTASLTKAIYIVYALYLCTHCVIAKE